MKNDRVLQEAEFNPKVCTYWLLSGGFILLVCIITIPLLPLWFIFGTLITRKYLEHISCTLTDRTLIVKKGWLNRVEKTIPLEKITDLALLQGPIMRAMDLHGLSVETAGSSGSNASGALVSLVGIVEVMGFRDTVLAQRDRIVGAAPAAAPADGGDQSQRDVLEDIRDSLHRIEQIVSNR